MAFGMCVGEEVVNVDVADEQVFSLPGKLGLQAPGMDRLTQEFYSSPVVAGRAELDNLLREFRAVADAHGEMLRERLARERKVRARGAVRERILAELTKDDPVLLKLGEIVRLLEYALDAGLDLRCSSD